MTCTDPTRTSTPAFEQPEVLDGTLAVSYTHLTLPTILRV